MDFPRISLPSRQPSPLSRASLSLKLADDFRRTFDEAAFVADMEEALKTGGVGIDALIARVERKAHGSN